MAWMKRVDYEILSELARNAKISDRQLAKKIGVSQPTVTRRRARLEKEVIDSYTLIPKWGKIGYTLFAITLVKVRSTEAEKWMAIRKRGSEWLMKHPNVIMSSSCSGNEIDTFLISIHKSFGDYDDLLLEMRKDMGDVIAGVQTLLVNLSGKGVMKPLDLKYLADAK
ncbi:MAG: Lrp/AsnC family transcriptional regulator [Candidatus Bathyarchaeota archaeon]|nr:Lrp/AsnC family transcriptional regulator [Candidatus Bathyarchaeota archaeon]